MPALAERGAVILPPMPAFYTHPKDIDDIVNHTVARVLDRLSLPQALVAEWLGTNRLGKDEPGGLPLDRHPRLRRGGESPAALGRAPGRARGARARPRGGRRPRW